LEYLVAGLGIAGMSLWMELDRRGRRAFFADAGDAGAASRVAPGVINPLAGKRLSPSWKVEEQLPLALSVYERMGELFGSEVLHRLPIIRIIKDAAQREFFDRRRAQPGSNIWIGREDACGRWPGLFEDPFGSFEASASGYLDVGRACTLARRKLDSEGRFASERVDPSAIEIANDCVRWHGMEFEKVIFAEGWRPGGNPFFPHVHFKPARGEMLELRAKGDLTAFPRAIVNRGKWILPMPDGSFRAGSTYSWDNFDSGPTKAAEASILGVLKEFVKAEFEVVGAKSGVRPIVKDYRPVLGRSKASDRVLIMNGLGSKGILAAPWLAMKLLDYSESGGELGETDVARFG